MPYAFGALFAFVFSVALIASDEDVQRYRDVFAAVLISTASVVGAFYTGSNDYDTYRWIYGSTPALLNLGDMKHWAVEPGFHVVIAVFRQTGVGYTAFLAIVIGTTLSFLYVGFRNVTPLPLLALLAYFPKNFFASNLNQLRSGVVIAVVAFLIVSYEQQRPLKYFVITAAAASIHVVAVIFVPIFLYLRLRVSKTRVVFLVTSALAVSFVGREALLFVESRIGLPNVLSFYLHSELFGEAVPILSIQVLRRVAVVILVVLTLEQVASRVPYYVTVVKFYIASVVFYFAFRQVGEIAERLSAVPGVTEVLIVSAAIYAFARESRTIAFVMVLLYVGADMALRGIPEYTVTL